KTGDTLSGDLTMGGNRVRGLANGVLPTDAATVAQLVAGVTDHSALSDRTGGEPRTQYQQESERSAINGYAGLGLDGRVAAAQAPIRTVYATGGAEAVSAGDVGAVAKAGDTLTGDLAMGGNRVRDLADGVLPGDAATVGQLVPGVTDHSAL